MAAVFLVDVVLAAALEAVSFLAAGFFAAVLAAAGFLAALFFAAVLAVSAFFAAVVRLAGFFYAMPDKIAVVDNHGATYTYSALVDDCGYFEKGKVYTLKKEADKSKTA